MTILCCGPLKSDIPGLVKCICCRRDLDPEQMAVSICWDCQTGYFDCEQCNIYGVPIDSFPDKNGEEHRFSGWLVDKLVASTACGITIPFSEAGQAIAVREWCKTCWPEGGRQWQTQE